MKSEDISHETVRSYLMGSLDEATVDTLDELSIADQGFADRIAAEQYDLIDDWIARRLDPPERAAFGNVLARSPALAEKVKIAQLMTAAPRAAVVERSTAPGFFASLFGGFPRPAYVLGGLALLIGMALAALLLVRQDTVTDLAEVSPSVPVSPASTISESAEIPQAPSPTSNLGPSDVPKQDTNRESRLKPSPEPTRRSSPVFATLILAPPTRGASGVQSVTLQSEAEFLRLTIQTEAESSGQYIVEVGDPAGNSDWRSQVIRGRSVNGRTAVTVRVPAANLKSGMRGVRLLDAAPGSEILDEHVVRIDR